MDYEVFISFKRGKMDGSGLTRDYELARDLHRTLTAKGVKVFFSERDLSSSSYVREIYKALDEAKILIVVGTHPSHVVSEWVHAEWETFLTAILGERKPDGEIYTYLENMSVNQLPLELYNRHAFLSDEKNELVARVMQNLGKANPSAGSVSVPHKTPVTGYTESAGIPPSSSHAADVRESARQPETRRTNESAPLSAARSDGAEDRAKPVAHNTDEVGTSAMLMKRQRVIFGVSAAVMLCILFVIVVIVPDGHASYHEVRPAIVLLCLATFIVSALYSGWLANKWGFTNKQRLRYVGLIPLGVCLALLFIFLSIFATALD